MSATNGNVYNNIDTVGLLPAHVNHCPQILWRSLRFEIHIIKHMLQLRRRQRELVATTHDVRRSKC